MAFLFRFQSCDDVTNNSNPINYVRKLRPPIWPIFRPLPPLSTVHVACHMLLGINTRNGKLGTRVPGDQ